MSAGTRLGQLMKDEPELTRPAASEEDERFLERFADYLTGDGCDARAMVLRMERLKFETIVQQKTFAEVVGQLWP